MNKATTHYSIFFCFLCLFSAGVLTIYALPLAKAEDLEQTVHPSPTPIDYNLLPIVEGLLLDNGGCDLPCWWGFKVGESTETDWTAFLENNQLVDGWAEIYPTDASGHGSGHIIYALGSWYADFRIGYSFTDNILNYLQIYFTTPGEWLSPEIDKIAFPGLLAQLETPQIYIRTDSLGQWSFKQINIWMVDKEAGVTAWYLFDISDRQAEATENYHFGSKLSLCLGLKETTEITITFQDPNAEGPVNDTLESLQSNSTFHTLDETFGVDAKTFTEFFIENPNGCLEVSYLKAE